MTIHILTLFPQMFNSVFSLSVINRAQKRNLVKIKIINIREFASDKHKTVDEKPYGGGAGMILKVDVLDKAIRSIKPKPYSILLSASGKKYSQKKAIKLAKRKNIALICGHYEGVDARIEKFVDEILSIGDYILTGGEIPAMVITDSIIRFIPGSLNPRSPINESFKKGLLEYPQYTRPAIYSGLKVPSVLIKGNHQAIEKWRDKQSYKITNKNRPDLLNFKKE